MYQDIAVARGSTYDTLNKRMDRCQENIETVSDDIQRLQGEWSVDYKGLQTTIIKVHLGNTKNGASLPHWGRLVLAVRWGSASLQSKLYYNKIPSEMEVAPL